MEITIEITEGCTNCSYLINGVEWAVFYNNGSEYYNIELLDKVAEALINEAQEQYQLPDWIVDYLYDGGYTSCCQDTFALLVRNNKRTILEDLGHCDECGDDIERMTLKLNINYEDNNEHTR